MARAHFWRFFGHIWHILSETKQNKTICYTIVRTPSKLLVGGSNPPGRAIIKSGGYMLLACDRLFFFILFIPLLSREMNVNTCVFP